MTTDYVKANRAALWRIQRTSVEELHSPEMWIWGIEDTQGKRGDWTSHWNKWKCKIITGTDQEQLYHAPGYLKSLLFFSLE